MRRKLDSAAQNSGVLHHVDRRRTWKSSRFLPPRGAIPTEFTANRAEHPAAQNYPERRRSSVRSTIRGAGAFRTGPVRHRPAVAAYPISVPVYTRYFWPPPDFPAGTTFVPGQEYRVDTRAATPPARRRQRNEPLWPRLDVRPTASRGGPPRAAVLLDSFSTGGIIGGSQGALAESEPESYSRPFVAVGGCRLAFRSDRALTRALSSPIAGRRIQR